MLRAVRWPELAPGSWAGSHAPRARRRGSRLPLLLILLAASCSDLPWTPDPAPIDPVVDAAPLIAALEAAGAPVVPGVPVTVHSRSLALAATVTVPAGAPPVTEVTWCRAYVNGHGCQGLQRIGIAAGQSAMVGLAGEVSTAGRHDVFLQVVQANGRRTASAVVAADFVFGAPAVRIVRVNGQAVVAGAEPKVAEELEAEVEVTLPADGTASPQSLVLFGPVGDRIDAWAAVPVEPALAPGETRTFRIHSLVLPAGRHGISVRALPYDSGDAITLSATNSDVAPPVISVLSHTSGTVTADSMITVRYAVEDTHSGLHSELLAWAWSVPPMNMTSCGVGSGAISHGGRVARVERSRSNSWCGSGAYPLRPGANRIVITALDNALNTATDTLTVVYQPPTR